ncbi:hypothetical protein AK812_SmicGene19029 [Symbiodinium microadriaticum]|uniref:MYND-type domain-containing protein n=2 Tax=Symbiodinium microadriaticum TaxID=2951 RepID=A0A1Q9DTM1_SYMMI|nr:hypothetical protein AK812_SmicGene19029 [Symbiodinium microadriaticum]
MQDVMQRRKVHVPALVLPQRGASATAVDFVHVARGCGPPQDLADFRQFLLSRCERGLVDFDSWVAERRWVETSQYVDPGWASCMGKLRVRFVSVLRVLEGFEGAMDVLVAAVALSHALHPWLFHRRGISFQTGFERKGIFKMPSDASVAAVAIFNDRYEVGYLCAAINAAYCEQHNYRFAPVVLSESEMEAICEGRHFAWAKVALLRWLYSHVGARGMQNSILEAKIGSAERDALLAADWLVWFDADLMVVNHSRPLDSFLYDQKDLILGEDMADLDWLNTGLMFCKVRSAWMKSLWEKVWHEGDAKFHLGEFWDQSALCGCLAKWAEFCPDVLGGKRVAAATETPWFSWQGGPRVRETEHLRVLDAGGTQTNNPRYARFAFHAAGMKDKSRCCRHIVEVGMVRDLQQPERAQLRCRSFSEGSQSAPDAWPAAFDVIGAAPASTGAPFGWPVAQRRLWPKEVPLQRKSLRTVRAQGHAAPVHILAEPPPSALSLAAMSDTPLGDRQVEMIDRAPRRADDLPPAGRPFGRQLRVRLWEAARYAAGTPPSAHAVLREMDPARAWQVNWRPWAAVGGASEVPRPELPAAFDADDHKIEEALLSVAPPGAEVRLHQLEEGRDWLMWQLDGTQQVVLFPPDCEKARMRGGKLFEPGQSAYVPWADDDAEPCSVVLLKGEALRVPGGWYLAQRSLAACVGLLCPLGPAQPNSAPLDLGPFHPEELQRAAAKLLEREQEGNVSPGLPEALKQTLQAGGTEAPHVPRYNAVCHVGLYLGRPPKLMRTSRGASPQVFCLGADASLKPIEKVLRAMLTGERALIAFPSEAKVLDVEILAVLCPECPDDPRQDFSNLYSRAWWSWFEDPLQWQPLPSRDLPTGAPCAHCGLPPGVLRCAGCHQVAYCSKACQREDWPYHRSSCAPGARHESKTAPTASEMFTSIGSTPREDTGKAPKKGQFGSEEMATKVFATDIVPWDNHEWPEVFATSKSMSPQAFLAFRFISAAIFLGHAVAHLLWRLEEGDGWFYWAYLTHIAVWVEVVSEILLVVLAIQGYRSLSAPRLSTLPTLVRVGMAVYAIVLPVSLLVVVLYWTLVRPIWDVVSGVEEVPSYLSIFVHLLNFILLIVGLFLSRLPYSIKRIGWSLLFGFGYVAWTLIHFWAQIGNQGGCDQYPTRQECPLYDAWDWNEPTIPTIISVALLFVLPLVGLIYAGFVRCRNSSDPLLKNKNSSVPMGENLEEGKTNVDSVEKFQK